ncbi:MAG: hypothetical protein ACI87E_002653 [Mariniblastus sp.]
MPWLEKKNTSSHNKLRSIRVFPSQGGVDYFVWNARIARALNFVGTLPNRRGKPLCGINAKPIIIHSKRKRSGKDRPKDPPSKLTNTKSNLIKFNAYLTGILRGLRWRNSSQGENNANARLTTSSSTMMTAVSFGLSRSLAPGTRT